MMLQETHSSEIESILSRFADRRSAVLPLLYIAQDTYGHLSAEVIREVADVLSLPHTDVFEVVSFYTLYYDRPVGKWVLQVCDDVPCCYLGAEELITALKQQLGIQEEQTTADGMFTLQRVKCLAACDRAPLLQANLEYVYDVTAERAEILLNTLRQRANSGESLSVSGHVAEDYEFMPDGTTLRLIERNLGDMPGPPAPPQMAEAEKAVGQAEEPPASEPALAEAEQQIEQETPVEPALDQSPAGAHPAPDTADDQEEDQAVPAHAAQQDSPDLQESPVQPDAEQAGESETSGEDERL